MKYSEIVGGDKSKGVTVCLLTLVYPNGQGMPHSLVKTKSLAGEGGSCIPVQRGGIASYRTPGQHRWVLLSS